MEPWNGYTLDDPRSIPGNWAQGDGYQWQYVGPAVTPSGEYGPPPQPAYDPLSSAYVTPATLPAAPATLPANPSYVPPAPPPGAGYSPPTNTPSAANYPAQEYQYQSALNTGALQAPPSPPPQPAYDPLSSATPTPAPEGYATTPPGDNFTYTAPPPPSGTPDGTYMGAADFGYPAIAPPSAGAGYSPPTNTPSATPYPAQEYQYQSSLNAGSLESPYGPPPQPAYDPLSSAYTAPAAAPTTYSNPQSDAATYGVPRGTYPSASEVIPPPHEAYIPGAPPQPAYDPLSSAYPTPAPAGYATTPPGDNFTYTAPPGTPAGTYRGASDFGHPAIAAPSSAPFTYSNPQSDAATHSQFSLSQAEPYSQKAIYDLRLANGEIPMVEVPDVAPASAPASAAPSLMGGNGVPNAGAMTAATNPALPATTGPYGGGGGYPTAGGGGSRMFSAPSAPSPGGGLGGGYPYPTFPDSRPYGPSAGPPDPRGFDPFAFAGVPDPRGPGNGMRGQMMAGGPQMAGGPAGAPPAAMAPPSTHMNRKMLMDAMRLGGQIADANRVDPGPKPMSGLEYVARRLKLDPHRGQQGF